MSKTFRWKNHEQTQRRVDGSRISGFYTARTTYHHTGNGHGGIWIYAAMTGRSLWKARRRAHGETRSRERSPSPFSRQEYERSHRGAVARELHRFSRDPDYEVMVPLKPEDCWEGWY